MISVEEARARMTGAFQPVSAETVGLAEGLGRVLAEDLVARVTQPPAAVSAMDGYAVRAADVAEAPITLTQIGKAPAGSAYNGLVGPGQTVRIFTGAPLPQGADRAACSTPSMVLISNSWVMSMAVLGPTPGTSMRVKTPSGSSATSLS